MAGNSQRRGRRKLPKKGAPVGSGGQRRGALKGKGPTLRADERPWHKAYSGTEPLPERTAWKQEKERRAAAAEGRAPRVGQPGSRDTTGGKAAAGKSPAGKAAAGKKAAGKGTAGKGAAGKGTAGRGTAGRAAAGKSPAGRTAAGKSPAAGRSPSKAASKGPARASARKPENAPELLVGRNPVVEALRAHIPATALYVAQGIDVDDRINESLRTAGDRGIAILEVSRAELDRLSDRALHQGLGLQVPPYAYLPFEDVLNGATEHPEAPLLVALDGVTDPRNLGAVIRSAAAFGAHGVFLPQRRAAGMTATAWRTSAGAAARLPVARVTNLTRAIKTCQEAGFVAVGLDADAPTGLYELEAAVGPLLVVVGSEGRGLSRLVGATCDLRVSIPMSSQMESLNASVAAAVTLAEVARRRAEDAAAS